MFVNLLFIAAALLQFGESQDQCPCSSDLVELKQDMQRDYKSLNRLVSTGNQLVTDNMTPTLQALTLSVTTGNQQVVDILANTKSLVNATHMAIQQKQCATREEVRAEVVSLRAQVSVVQTEVGTLRTLVSGVQSEVGSLRTRVSGVQSEVGSLRTQVSGIQSEVGSLRTQVSGVQTEVGSLRRYVAEVQQNLLQAMHPGSQQNPALSCKNIPSGSPSRSYWIQGTFGPPTQQYCDMTRACCNSIGGWMRVANLDMTDPNQQCPSGFRLVTSPRRTCGRHRAGCVSTTYPVHGVEYSRVCGRIIGYEYGTPDAFAPYYYDRSKTIDGVYVDGVSLTHGSSPRKHIWTFVAAYDEQNSNQFVCPCTRRDRTYTGTVPPFIGQDYFCETGSRGHNLGHSPGTFYPEDPLWNGRGCGPQSTCCSFNNPPWFCKQLPQPTTDDIELRLCGDGPLSDEDNPLEVVEIYVQ